MTEVRCIYCNSKFGEVKRGHFEMVSSTNLPDFNYEYVEKIKCGRCKNFNIKVIGKEEKHEE